MDCQSYSKDPLQKPVRNEEIIRRPMDAPHGQILVAEVAGSLHYDVSHSFHDHLFFKMSPTAPMFRLMFDWGRLTRVLFFISRLYFP